VAIAIAIVVGAVWFAYRNCARGRGDRKGALRLACVVFVVEMAIFLCRAHFVLAFDTLFLFILAVSTALFASGFLWMLYLALEPYVRRNWPQIIISWTRLMAGRLRDPLVGRDVISGVALGMAWVLIFELGVLVSMRSGGRPQLANEDYLLGIREAAATWLGTVVGSILGTLLFFFLLVMLRVLVRNQWLAALLFVLIFAGPKVLAGSHMLTDAWVWASIYAIAAVAVVRLGFIVLAIGSFLADVLLNLPYTLDFSNWYASHCVFIVLTFLAAGVWGFYASLAGKPLWKDELFE
jgi:hypothetical protein